MHASTLNASRLTSAHRSVHGLCPAVRLQARRPQPRVAQHLRSNATTEAITETVVVQQNGHSNGNGNGAVAAGAKAKQRIQVGAWLRWGRRWHANRLV